MKAFFSTFATQLQDEVRRTAAEAKKFAQEAGTEARQFGGQARAYFESDLFEEHLDAFAAEVGIHWATQAPAPAFQSESRKVRIAAKSAVIVQHLRSQIGATAAASVTLTASLVQSPQVIAGVTLACAGGLSLYYVWVAAEIVTRARAGAAKASPA